MKFNLCLAAAVAGFLGFVLYWSNQFDKKCEAAGGVVIHVKCVKAEIIKVPK